MSAMTRFVRDAFTRAKRLALDNQVWLSRAGPNSQDADPQFAGERRWLIAPAFRIARQALSRWLNDNMMQNSAALAYYTAFSIAPILLLAIGLAGIFLGHAAVQARIMDQISGLVGAQSTRMLTSMIEGISNTGKGTVATIISLFSILLGATGVLGSMKTTLNQIWRTKEDGDIKEIVKRNAVFLGMILGIGFLLVVSLVISTAIAALGAFVASITPTLEFMIQAVSFFVSLAIETVLFAAIYKFLPNFDVQWRDVWIGAIIAALLFSFGKIALGYYLGRSAISSYYGAASSLLILLLWIYYSGLILYFGAEVTAVASGRFDQSAPSRKPR